MGNTTEKQALTTEQQIRVLKARIDDAWTQIHWMQKFGGHVDSATLARRCARLEERTELAEANIEMLNDVAAHHQTMMADHLQDRHDCDLVRDNAIDVVSWRKIRRRMLEWVEKVGLLKRRRDVVGAHREENRLRPAVTT